MTVESTVQALVARLKTITDWDALQALAEREALFYDEEIFAALEVAAADPASGLTAQHQEWLAELRRRAERDLPAVIAALIQARDIDDLRMVADQWPLALTDAFVEMMDQLAQRFGDAGQPDVAQGIRHRLVGLAQLRAQREEWAGTPQAKAIFEFLNAADDAAALAVFQEYRQLLAHPEAQRTLDDVLQGGDPESQQRIERRRELLRYLRGQEHTQ